MIHHLLHHTFHTSAVTHRVKNYLLYEHLSHFEFEDVLSSSVRSTGSSRDAYTFEGSRVVNHTDTHGPVVLLCSSVSKDFQLVAASFPCWSKSRLLPIHIRRVLQERQIFIDVIYARIE